MAFDYKVHISVPMDTALPRDRVVVTPWFSDTVDGNAQAIADSCRDVLVAAAGSWFNGSFECRADVYRYLGENVESGPPAATSVKNLGNPVVADMPREVALCVSFYSGSNAKRRRGRLYLPVAGSGATKGARPDTSAMTRALAVATRLGVVGPNTCTWCVHSGVDHVLRPVSNAWVDDEWDTQRRRGLKGTTRQQTAITP
jgi:hypothetical protein